MILTLDIGNTNIKCGLFENGKLHRSWRMSSNREKTADEIGIAMESFFMHIHRSPTEVEGIIVSSVIPSINYTIEHMCQLYFPGPKPLFVGPGVRTGINLRYENPRTLGADRICNAVAAWRLYGGPMITIDFGTATTFGALNEKGDFLGGAICPGIKISSATLIEKTAQLPKVELIKPKTMIGSNTIHCIQSGIVYGYVGQVDYLIEGFARELGMETPRVVATGGMAKLIAGESRYNVEINSTLTLQGLYMIYEMNTVKQR